VVAATNSLTSAVGRPPKSSASRARNDRGTFQGKPASGVMIANREAGERMARCFPPR
jgi:hypothetical protein